MANLPTAYASQNFGRKALDFYAAGGEVSGAHPRARADERSLTDYDGAKHTVRLMERDYALEAGDQASVLRLQSGPARRSRPVAVVNHTRNTWCRTHPGASGLLSRTGIARNVNWFLSIMLFAMAAIAVIWPYLRVFLVELDPSVFGAAPLFNVFSLAAAAIPDLQSWSFGQTVAPISTLIGYYAPNLAEHADRLVFLGASFIGAALVFAVRSWRLLWAPLFVGSLGAASLGLGGVEGAAGHTVTALALAAAVFMVGGLVNRIRDAARLERRIALLADHLLRHAPEESVSRLAPDHEDAVSHDRAPAPMAAALEEVSHAEDAIIRNADTDIVTTETAAAEDVTGSSPADTLDADLVMGEEKSPEASDRPVSADHKQAEADIATADPEVNSGPEPQGLEPQVDKPETAPEEAFESGPKDQALEEQSASAEVLATKAPDVGSHQEHSTVPDSVEVDLSDHQNADAEPLNAAGSETVGDHTELANEAAELHDNSEGRTLEEDPVMAGIDPEEAERLKTDPRYAARAIVLPTAPPMPTPTVDDEKRAAPDADTLAIEANQDSGLEPAATAKPASTPTRELRPNAPLRSNVVPIFSAPPAPPAPPAPSGEEGVD